MLRRTEIPIIDGNNVGASALSCACAQSRGSLQHLACNPADRPTFDEQNPMSMARLVKGLTACYQPKAEKINVEAASSSCDVPGYGERP